MKQIWIVSGLVVAALGTSALIVGGRALFGDEPAPVTATPARLCVCSTQAASSRAAWMQLWMVKPAGFTGNGESLSLLHCMSTLMRLDAVISSNISP